jgi:hypothetical protein
MAGARLGAGGGAARAVPSRLTTAAT